MQGIGVVLMDGLVRIKFKKFIERVIISIAIINIGGPGKIKGEGPVCLLNLCRKVKLDPLILKTACKAGGITHGTADR